MKKVLIIIAPKDFQDTEYAVPKEIFEKEGFIVTTASTSKDCVGVFGSQLTADLLLGKIKPNDFEAVVLVGGGGAQVYFNDQKVRQILRDFYESGKIAAAICISPATLAKAGLLSGKKATVFPDPALVKIIKQSGGEYTGHPVEVDGRIITATDPTAADEFAHKIVGALKDKERR